MQPARRDVLRTLIIIILEVNWRLVYSRNSIDTILVIGRAVQAIGAQNRIEQSSILRILMMARYVRLVRLRVVVDHFKHIGLRKVQLALRRRLLKIPIIGGHRYSLRHRHQGRRRG